MRILLTGATGLLGSAIVRRFGDSCDLITVGKSAPKSGRIIDHIHHDFEAPGDFGPAGIDVDAVVHLAQSREFRRFPDSAHKIWNVNVTSTQKLLEFSRTQGVSTFVLASTGGLYEPLERPLQENDHLRLPETLDYYFATKLAAEALCGSYGQFFNIVIARPFFMFGPGQDSGQLMPRLLASLRLGRPIRINEHGGMLFNPLFADDAAEAIISILESRFSGIINLAGQEVMRLQQFASHIGIVVGQKPLFEVVDGVSLNFVADTTRMQQLRVPMTTPIQYALQKAIHGEVTPD